MAALLYRLGWWCHRRRGRVVGVWAGLVLLVTGAAVAGGGHGVDSFSIPGTESQRALGELRRDLPEAAGAALTLVVRAPAGQSLDSDGVKAAVARVTAEAAALPGVVTVADPYESGRIDRTRAVGVIEVRYAHALYELTRAERQAFDGLADDGVEVVPGGLPVGAPRVGVRELAGLGVAVVLLVVLGSLVAAGATLVAACAGVALGAGGVLLAAKVVDVSSVGPALVVMLGLGTGLAFAVFVAARQRRLLTTGLRARPGETAPAVGESVARATGTAGPPVLVGGAIVVVSLGGLAVVGVPFLTVLGLVAAGAVGLGAAAALTLLPALLSMAGPRVLPRRGGHARPGDDGEAGARWVRAVLRFRVPLLVGLVLGMSALTVPARGLRLALPDNGSAPAGSHQRMAYDQIAAAFGPGANGPLLVVVRGPRGDVVSALTGRVVAAVRKVHNVSAVEAGPAAAGGTTRVVTVTPVTGPGTAETVQLVGRVRAVAEPLAEGTGSVAVTGTTAVGVDVSRRMTAALPEYLLLVLGVSVLLLLLAFRSLLVPVAAALGFLLTMGATLGLTTWLHGPGPLTSFLPTVLVGVLFGLAMTYEVSLQSRVRELVLRGEDPVTATVAGVGRGAGTVAVAGLVMAGVFSGFVLIEDPTVRAIGFGLAVGVLVDVFAVRLILVPAAMTMLGARVWELPRWLDRLMPHAVLDSVDRRRGGRHVARRAGPVRA
ncbi:MMPL family transporter [Actinoplanes sp. RD1]|uniref:MMPL family transporter n=1 Tax=Actinoplanes sp. RD1 TaxID=3064538 RepID=UPI002740B138|nr:MMPL family transporter [Actinoplanes sp. RD1]